MTKKKTSYRGIIQSLGLVFGDIGTSPIYTMTVVFMLMKPTHDNILGVLSLIFWTLVLLVFVQFDWLAMSLSRRGEGGKIVLKEILVSLLSSRKESILITAITFVGVSLLMGDSILTPAISILSAVERAVLIPGLENLSRTMILRISAFIAIALFSDQSRGTEKVAGAIGPITGIWFLSLVLVGISAILEVPEVLKALNPYWGMQFLLNNGFAGFIPGHPMRRPRRRAPRQLRLPLEYHSRQRDGHLRGLQRARHVTHVQVLIVPREHLLQTVPVHAALYRRLDRSTSAVPSVDDAAIMLRASVATREVVSSALDPDMATLCEL